MNTNNVVSAPAAGNLTGKEYYCVKVTSTGIDLAGSSDGAKVVGTLLRGQTKQEDAVYAGKAVGILLRQGSIHFATIGASSAAVAAGAGLILDANVENAGKLTPSESSPIAIAWDAFTAADGAIVRVKFLS